MKNICKKMSIAAVLGLTLTAGSAQAASITLTTIVRDFAAWNGNGNQTNPDFENAIADDKNIVQTTLGGDGTPVYNPGAHSSVFGTDNGSLGTLTTAQYFDQWFHNTPGYNQAFNIDLTLNDIGGGIYQYNNNSFFPIDGQGFGDQGQSHNYGFTLQMHTMFTYQAGQTFDFTGDDDVWVFINNQRVIDLGGVHGPESASVNLDTLGLIAGNDYAFDFFFAERHTSGSNLQISTSIALQNNTPTDVPEPLTLSVFGAGVAGAIAMRRRKKQSA